MSLRVSSKKVDFGGALRRHATERIDEAADGSLTVEGAVTTPELSDSPVVFIAKQRRLNVAHRPADRHIARTDSQLDTLASASS